MLLVLIPLTIVIALLQPICQTLLLLTKITPTTWTDIITKTPWPQQVLTHSQQTLTLLWWVIWCIPVAHRLKNYYRGYHPFLLIVITLMCQGLLIPLVLANFTLTQACIAGVFSTITCIILIHTRRQQPLVSFAKSTTSTQLNGAISTSHGHSHQLFTDIVDIRPVCGHGVAHLVSLCSMSSRACHDLGSLIITIFSETKNTNDASRQTHEPNKLGGFIRSWYDLVQSIYNHKPASVP